MKRITRRSSSPLPAAAAGPCATCRLARTLGRNSHIRMRAVKPALQDAGVVKQILALKEYPVVEVFGSEKLSWWLCRQEVYSLTSICVAAVIALVP